jgi:tetratricopeptide (TPR) repeat protein
MPASVQSLLTARVDRLTPVDRALLQTAAVIGRRFAPDLLATVIAGEGVEARLAAMQQLDLVRLEGTANEFVFKHALVRDALYTSLLSSQRQALHLRIAVEIERRNVGRLSEVAETLAHHYSHADHREKAVEYLALVGRKAIRIYSLDEGERSLRMALSMVRTDDSGTMEERTATIMTDLAVVYYMQYRAADTIDLIEPELDNIALLGDTVETAILLDIYGVALFTSNRFREAKEMAHRALAIADPLGDHRSQAHARAGVIMMSAYVDPPLAAFEAFAQKAYTEAEEGEDTYTVVRMTLVVANYYMHRGLVREGRQYAYRLMKFGRERQDRRAQGMALWLLGWFDILAEDFTAALGHGEECVATAYAPYDVQWGRHVVGVSLLLLGRVAEGIAMMQKHRRHALANGWNHAALLAEAPLGVSLLLSGHLRKGVRAPESLIDRCESEYQYPGYADWTRVFLAEFYVALLTGARKPPFRVVVRNLFSLAIAKWGAARKAEPLLRKAAQNPQFSERGVFRARIDFNLGLIQQALSRTDLARTHLDRAREIAISQDAPAIIEKVDAVIASLS